MLFVTLEATVACIRGRQRNAFDTCTAVDDALKTSLPDANPTSLLLRNADDVTPHHTHVSDASPETDEAILDAQDCIMHDSMHAECSADEASEQHPSAMNGAAQGVRNIAASTSVTCCNSNNHMHDSVAYSASATEPIHPRIKSNNDTVADVTCGYTESQAHMNTAQSTAANTSGSAAVKRSDMMNIPAQSMTPASSLLYSYAHAQCTPQRSTTHEPVHSYSQGPGIVHITTPHALYTSASCSQPPFQACAPHSGAAPVPDIAQVKRKRSDMMNIQARYSAMHAAMPPAMHPRHASLREGKDLSCAYPKQHEASTIGFSKYPITAEVQPEAAVHHTKNLAVISAVNSRVNPANSAQLRAHLTRASQAPSSTVAVQFPSCTASEGILLEAPLSSRSLHHALAPAAAAPHPNVQYSPQSLQHLKSFLEASHGGVVRAALLHSESSVQGVNCEVPTANSASEKFPLQDAAKAPKFAAHDPACSLLSNKAATVGDGVAKVPHTSLPSSSVMNISAQSVQNSGIAALAAALSSAVPGLSKLSNVKAGTQGVAAAAKPRCTAAHVAHESKVAPNASQTVLGFVVAALATDTPEAVLRALKKTAADAVIETAHVQHATSVADASGETCAAMHASSAEPQITQMPFHCAASASAALRPPILSSSVGDAPQAGLSLTLSASALPASALPPAAVEAATAALAMSASTLPAACLPAPSSLIAGVPASVLDPSEKGFVPPPSGSRASSCLTSAFPASAADPSQAVLPTPHAPSAVAAQRSAVRRTSIIPHLDATLKAITAAGCVAAATSAEASAPGNKSDAAFTTAQVTRPFAEATPASVLAQAVPCVAATMTAQSVAAVTTTQAAQHHVASSSFADVLIPAAPLVSVPTSTATAAQPISSFADPTFAQATAPAAAATPADAFGHEKIGRTTSMAPAVACSPCIDLTDAEDDTDPGTHALSAGNLLTRLQAARTSDSIMHEADPASHAWAVVELLARLRAGSAANAIDSTMHEPLTHVPHASPGHNQQMQLPSSAPAKTSGASMHENDALVDVLPVVNRLHQQAGNPDTAMHETHASMPHALSEGELLTQLHASAAATSFDTTMHDMHEDEAEIDRNRRLLTDLLCTYNAGKDTVVEK